MGREGNALERKGKNGEGGGSLPGPRGQKKGWDEAGSARKKSQRCVSCPRQSQPSAPVSSYEIHLLLTGTTWAHTITHSHVPHAPAHTPAFGCPQAGVHLQPPPTWALTAEAGLGPARVPSSFGLRPHA